MLGHDRSLLRKWLLSNSSRKRLNQLGFYIKVSRGSLNFFFMFLTICCDFGSQLAVSSILRMVLNVMESTCCIWMDPARSRSQQFVINPEGLAGVGLYW